MTENVKKNKAKVAIVLNKNVKHNGKLYKKGSDCPPDLVKLFTSKGFVN